MEFAIKVLTEKLARLQDSYIKYVDNGDISHISKTATNQIEYIESCEKAIAKLNE